MFGWLNDELFRLSNSPITPLTLLIIVGAATAGAVIGPRLSKLLNASISGRASGAGVPASQARFGTFSGVFTPSILTILGVVMYLRMGWVVGNSGLGGALIILGVSHVITVITGLSVSSIATNRTVGAGGAYFIISRSLGAPVGAAIGIPLFLGQALSVTFYVVGFTESLRQLAPSVAQHERLVSSALLLLLVIVSLKSADLALKLQYFVMAAIALSLISFFAGNKIQAGATTLEWWVNDRAPFAEVFAIFFPAVTGIMAGVGMSGDLKDPRTALPRGTMAAIFCGLIIYAGVMIWLAITANTDYLADPKHKDAMWQISRLPALIYAGVWGATISSAVGSLLTAPRTLQALAADGLAPRLFARGHGPTNEPRVGIVMTFLLAQLGVLIGGLDAIGPILTMFFLATYGLTNLACGLEKWAASPSFRPDFTVPALVSVIGGIACFYVMSVIDMLAMFGALVICAGIYVIAQRRALGTTYGDARHGIWSALVRSALQRLRRAEFHALNWRPNLVILGGDHERRPWLLRLGSAIVQDRGIVTYVHMLPGEVEPLAERRRELARSLDDHLHNNYPNVFGRVDVSRDKYRGMITVAQTYGIGSFEANTIMIGWPRHEENRYDYVQVLRDLVCLDRSLLITHYNRDKKFGDQRTIHIWWGGLQGNGGLMLLIAYLLTAHHDWRHASVSILTVVETERDRRLVTQAIDGILAGARLEATPRVILREDRTIADIMHGESAGADLAIVGLRLPQAEPQAIDQFFARMNSILQGMPTTLLVHSARNLEAEPVLFDAPAGPRAVEQSGVRPPNPSPAEQGLAPQTPPSATSQAAPPPPQRDTKQ
ncbi:MAG: Na-K-Cl cotransporter [Deltaproteobacteria bacterium]|nr:Na-K-Cl cotransporter [Deltaproteobacteria bacterium]